MTEVGRDEATRDELRLLTERMLLSALREQEASAVASAARDRSEFLAEASLRFGASLDQELTYAAIASVALPGLDAWCIVDVVEINGALRRLAVVHRDEDKALVARTLAETWIPDTDDPIGIPAIRRKRQPLRLDHGADDVLSAASRDATAHRILQELGVGPLLVVPITSRDELLGAITFVGRPDALPYSEDDVEVAEALALRCAQALEGARLYAAAKAASAAADAARAEAEAANATKTQFLRTMSHELRTPLNAISGYAQLLEMGLRGPVTPEQRADLASIRRSQAHLLGLVESVLNYAQIQAGRTVYGTDELSLTEIVTGMEEFVKPQMSAKELTYRCDLGSEPMTVCADAGKVRQIMLNLLGNATKFTPRGGSITVSCVASGVARHERDGAPLMHAITVTDTGAGIPADKQATIFDPFVQIVGPELTSSKVGVGLGLAISRDLARGMGGDLVVESVMGQGSTFTLTLPAA